MRQIYQIKIKIVGYTPLTVKKKKYLNVRMEFNLQFNRSFNHITEHKTE